MRPCRVGLALWASRLFSWTLMLIAFWGTGAVRAEKCPNMLIVLDRSGSMIGFKWETAVQSINTFVPQHHSVMRFGLMVFPATSANACAGGQQKVNCEFFAADTISKMLAQMSGPGGYTPTAETMSQAGKLPDMSDPFRRRYIILLTDGDPTCPDNKDLDGNLKLTVQNITALTQSGVKTFVIGFGQEVSPGRLDQMAQAGDTARVNATCANPAAPGTRIPCKYYDASDQASLDAAFDAIASVAQGELVGNSCDDSCYVVDGCPQGQRCQQNIVAFDDGKYTLNLGTCVADPCSTVTCADKEFCREGRCVKACTDPCPSSQICQDGECVADPCADPSQCACALPCARYLACIKGNCGDEPCRYVSCPATAPYCNHGSCYAASPADAQGRSTQPSSQKDDSDDEKKGCSCSSAPSALLGFPAIWLLIRALARPRRD